MRRLRLDKEDAEIDKKYLFRQGKEGGDNKEPEVDAAGGEDGGAKVGGDSGKPDYQDDLPQTRVRE